MADFNIADFDWDEFQEVKPAGGNLKPAESSDDDDEDIKPDTPVAKEPKKAKEPEKTEKTEEPKAKEPEKAPEVSEEEEEEEEEEVAKVIDWTSTVTKLGTALGIDIPNGEIQEEDALDFITETIQLKVEDGIDAVLESWKEKIGEDGINFVSFTMKGGKVEDFLKSYEPLLYTSDISNDVGKKSFLLRYLVKDGMEEDDAQDQIDRWEEKDQLEAKTASFMKKLKDKNELARRAVVDSAKAEEAQRIKKYAETEAKLRKDFAKIQTVAGVKFSEFDVSQLSNYILKPAVQVGDRAVPKFSAELARLRQEEPDKFLLLAKLVKDGLTEDALTKLFKQKALRQVERELESKPNKSSSPTRPPTNKPVWDLID